ncbi:hypothetical protein CQW49_18235 [Methylosinus trichosporium OB3b]|uniref:Serine kinase n=1 Tax=Methylosinus trichosporium (strain ATCC 35070 / NCIMB 11131 / UNIQEM 75 / OB3b) TaxID=595536 RepID=A0A2D2D3Q9_METT3|nr:hypothetical protein CQW49_18235 [Methylosinus trichosporium OB3b]OBS52025.1 hypothetical protein A8B73_13310 [Methylosinus sp. 3S-1]
MTDANCAEHHCSCFGLHIRSQIALPEIDECPPHRQPSLPLVAVRRGDLGELEPYFREGSDRLHVEDSGVAFSVAGVARYLVKDGREIVVDAIPGASPRSIRLFLLGSAFGILCHQRGLTPLHANAIVLQGEAVAFAGPTGAGKSTLAAYFLSRGCHLLCDDVCVVSFDRDGAPLAWPGPPRLKLWRDAVASLGHDDESLERVVEGHHKFHMPFSRGLGDGPFPLRRLYVLGAAPAQSDTSFRRLRGVDAIDAIFAQTYRNRFLGRMGLRARHLQLSAAIARRTEIFVASRQWGFGVFEREAERILQHAGRRQSGLTPSLAC